MSYTGRDGSATSYLRGDGTIGAISAGDLPSGIDAAKIGNGSISNTEYQYLNGVTSALQTQIDAKGAGTVTSVALTMPTGVFDISGSPVTGSGTLAVTFDTQTANTLFAGPTSGSAAAPAFRALVSADLPSHALLTVNTTPETFSNSSAENNFAANYTFSANSLAVGQVYRVRAWGVYGTDAVSSSTQRFRTKAGSTVLGDSTAKNNGLGLTNRGWQLEQYIVVTAIGATGTLECQGTCGMSTTATATGFCDMENTATITVDTTASLTIQISIENSVADADIATTMRIFMVERIM